ncbi:putative alpha-N-arabinofuranosidase C [Termitomyces sp. T112]|nr:putative alpha-N-arabinofuranosidase C [Termitomyces sp. T112]
MAAHLEDITSWDTSLIARGGHCWAGAAEPTPSKIWHAARMRAFEFVALQVPYNVSKPNTMTTPAPAVHIDPARIIDEVDPRIYSGFTEHMGRCIYGGLYDPDNQHGLVDPMTGFRTDVIDALRELNIPLVHDGIGPKELRPRRPELAWLTEESNQFGTDDFIQWCRTLGTEPYICLNMGTGTLEDALAWVEYCNSSANTYWANLRRKNGHEEAYNVKYWSLGNEVWGPWQGNYFPSPSTLAPSRSLPSVGQMESQDYAKKAYQWAKALKLLDPNIKLISCGETGFSDWDRVTLRKLAPVVDFHSVHLYTVSEGKHAVNVMGPAAAEKGLEITRALIDLAKIEGGLCKELTVCFDEWNVWDPVRAPGEKGAEEHYDLSDALAVAAWLNVFVRKADIVKIACIAQSVNVISPIITSPTGLFRQTTYYPLHLFANLMQGTSLDVFVSAPSPSTFYTGPTVPKFVQDLTKHTPDAAKLTKYVDVSAVLSRDGREIRVALLNRHEEESFVVPIWFAGGSGSAGVEEEVRVYEVWSENLRDGNTFGEERVRSVERVVRFEGSYEIKRHSFQGMVVMIVEEFGCG